MPDLHALLADEARRQEPASAPDFDELVVRVRRRHTRRALAAVSGSVSVVVALALGGWLLRPSAPAPASLSAPTVPTSAVASPVALPVPAHVYTRLRDLALALAKQNGDPSPTRMEAVKVNPDLPASGRQPNPSTRPLTGGYVVEIRGSFVCSYCKGLFEIRGTVLRALVSDEGLRVTNPDLGNSWQELSRYGAPFALAGPTGAAAPPVSAEVYARLRTMAVQMGEADGDTHPTRMEAVAVVDVNAADQVMSGDVIGGAGAAGYVVQIQGTFVCHSCSGPPGAAMPHGTVAYAIVRAGAFDGEGGGLSDRWVDLNKLGNSFSLATPTTASPAAPAQPSVSSTSVATKETSKAPTSTPGAVTTSPSPKPGPTTLAAAEKLVLDDALNPGSARIAWGLATTAQALRAAGESMPADLPDATPMFVIAVHGDAMTDGGLAVKPALVHRYGVIWRGDGGIDGDSASLGSYFTRLEPPTLPQATVVPFASLSPMLQGMAQATSAEVADAIPVQVAVAAVRPQAGDGVRAALVHTSEQNGHSGLAWVVEVQPGSSPPSSASPPSQHVVDATTGEEFEAAIP